MASERTETVIDTESAMPSKFPRRLNSSTQAAFVRRSRTTQRPCATARQCRRRKYGAVKFGTMVAIDSDRMTDFNARDFEGMRDFFILSGFSDGPRSLVEVQQREKWAERLLVVAAARRGTQSFDSLATALERLQREGWLKSERSGEQPSPEITYSLTEAGEQRLEQERERRHLMVSQFVEDSELDASFRRFLDREGPFGP